MSIRLANAVLSAGVKQSATARIGLHDPRAVLAAAAAMRPHLQLDKRAAAAAAAAVDVAAAVDRLPQSQHIFLSFSIDRTNVPYVAERG